MNHAFTPDHEDSLKEFLNISMGKAANKLANLLNLHVTLTVPNISIASHEELNNILKQNQEYYYTQQSFFGQMQGEVLTLLSRKGGKELAKNMWRLEGDDTLSDNLLADCLLEVSNILSGASIQGLCNQIELKARVQPPVILEPDDFTLPKDKWQHTIILQVSFLIESFEFETKTVICFADSGFSQVIEKLDAWI
ncbi:chemotaxis protein CheC [Vibrio cidicii]|uniref:Chemotaxis protein CheC n=1 Tax=Vibrio cidicii TaxID=1763883 RepID=A0A151KU66_9VIBR|nr:chemotaxis protein CheX [Vibrio cidicii]EJN6826850.1 chemotaxis protein CheC [Vibrio cidicii]ELV8624291.1 chemotaxis protein CheC [Vibrio cidicii]KYN84492.1 chemotaxis protein CheC [Vibrio cidicii]KYN90909.1 chemotaxis protein CheC [Vibrio cidicii]MBG0753760.1 chemotaxis protein CheC [Vibrio cidicii]